MGRIQVVLDNDIEKELRSRSQKKGDMSNLINKTLRVEFGMEEKQQ